MIDKAVALTLKHGDEVHLGQCHVHIGERGGVEIKQVRARVSGQVKTWKTRPDAFQFPIKHGMYENGYIHDRNGDEFHTAAQCPLNIDPWLKMMTTPIIGNGNDDLPLMFQLAHYVMDSRNDLQLRAGAARRADYVVGVHPPRVPNDMLVKQFVQSSFEETFGRNLKAMLEAYPHLDPKELDV